MKDQYFGDINDYRKYGLLRILGEEGILKAAICWMLTPPDGRSDGRFIEYLDQPKDWRGFDPELFDHLLGTVLAEGVRSVHAIESSKLLSETRFYSEIVSDAELDRNRYFATFLEAAKGSDLVFFDPDNGMEIRSAPYGRKTHRSSCSGKKPLPHMNKAILFSSISISVGRSGNPSFANCPQNLRISYPLQRYFHSELKMLSSFLFRKCATLR